MIVGVWSCLFSVRRVASWLIACRLICQLVSLLAWQVIRQFGGGVDFRGYVTKAVF